MGYQPFTHEVPNVTYAAPQQTIRAYGVRGALKRVTDIVLASLAIVFLSPVMLPLALFIRLSDGGKALFVQQRIGRNGKEFRCYKFRSMVIDAQECLDRVLAANPDAREEWLATQKLTDDPRITKFGSFLRRSSLDELPQLINILRGEMSIVGPRPIIRAEIDKYGPYFGYYCHVRPGLTGLWQVSGRSETSYEKRVALDVAYVTTWKYLGDFKIMLQTIPAVVRSVGAK